MQSFLWFLCLGRIANIPFLLRRHFWIDDFSGLFLRWDMWIPWKVVLNQFVWKRIVLLHAHPHQLNSLNMKPSLWYHEVSQDELKNNELWLFEKKLPDDSRKTNTVRFLQTKTMDLWMSCRIEWEAPKFDMSTTCMSDVRFFGFRRVLTHGNQPFWHMAGLKYSSWKWPRKYNRCFASQTFIPSLFDGMVYNFWGMFLWYLAVIDHEFLTRLLFFPKFSTQQWVKEEIGSWKKLHEDHHYHYIINGVYTLILFNFYVHFCKLLQHTQQNIYSIYYYTYTYTYVHLIIYPYGFQY